MTVTNADPTVAATFTVASGDATLDGTYSDPGTEDTHTATVDWGDGTGVQTVSLTPDVGGGGGTLGSGPHVPVDRLLRRRGVRDRQRFR